ncbi:TraR/DksA C4-type zinc finger protein [Vibrio sp. 10N.261.55.A7]|uniref:TraR/DksA C4-type zinc finger protein n=1 Tax=Vibrio sp. 10N.261.55.A7 TaxID=1880851 RepID=UPI000C859E82|nr:TraR/DksA C4-type zinc finger protein [Vibrio sp. 10N.261.55.A7]PMJ92858.1 molecular chaperone DnaK [Vibrio sp. 10N.261.55.A7]
MTDLLDHASGLETQFTEVALATQLKRASQNANKISAHKCNECGEKIPQARREASQGCDYCIHCQALADKGLL